MRAIALPILASLAITVTVGCGGGGDDILPPGTCFIDQGRFYDLSATSDAPPRLRWCGAPAASLSVRFFQSQRVVWRIECTEELLCIDPGVTYGVAPDSTSATTQPEALRAATAYELCLFGLDGNPETVCGQFQI
jgi:hypothetical protein